MKIRLSLAVIALVALASSAEAVIERLTPLSQFIADAEQILVVKVERLDPAKPAAWLTVTETLKGKAEFERLAVNLKGTPSKGNSSKGDPSNGSTSKDGSDESKQLLERLEAGLPVVLFVTELRKQKVVYAYTNGTWLQILGVPDGQQTRWAFTHLEPYLPRTFAGSTDELRTVLGDAIAGKSKPPEPNAKLKPGVGPSVSKPASKAGE
jgi:hypothetical protein